MTLPRQGALISAMTSGSWKRGSSSRRQLPGIETEYAAKVSRRGCAPSAGAGRSSTPRAMFATLWPTGPRGRRMAAAAVATSPLSPAVTTIPTTNRVRRIPPVSRSPWLLLEQLPVLHERLVARDDRRAVHEEKRLSLGRAVRTARLPVVADGHAH